MNVYVQFHSGVFPTLAEGQVCPLLKKKAVGDPVDPNYEWAFAITRVTATGSPPRPNNNGLLAALLQAIGFRWDPNSGDYSSGALDFFYADSSGGAPLLDPLNVSNLFSNFPSPRGIRIFCFDALSPINSR